MTTKRRPTVVLDARKAADFGIGSYLQGLAAGLARTEVPAELLLAGGPAAAELAGRHGLGYVPLGARGYSLGEQVAIPRLARRLGAELWHFPHYVTPLLLDRPHVVTVHDLIHIERPRDRTPLAYPYALLLLTRALQRARVVITATEAAARGIAALAPEEAAKVRVVPHAVLPELLRAPSAEERAAARTATGGAPFVLFVGNEMPHKNLTALLRAAAVLPRSARVVLAGVPAGDERPWAREARLLEVADRVLALGKVDVGLLRGLYAEARAFVFPSLAEGFGLPPLEALAQGTPVLASRIPPLLEVLGGSADYFDPSDGREAEEALARIFSRGRGDPADEEGRRQRALGYSWEASAAATAACYAEALAGTP